MRTTKWHFGIIISAILIVLNIFLLYSNVDRQNQIDLLKSGFSNQDRTGEILNATTISHSGVELTPRKISLLVFFPDISCSSCMEYEVRNLNSMYKKFYSHIQVYVIGRDSTLLDRYGSEFPVSLIHSSESVFDADIQFVNPFVVLTDPEGNLHTFYLSEADNYEKSNRFWQRMEVFFKAITVESPTVPLGSDMP